MYQPTKLTTKFSVETIKWRLFVSINDQTNSSTSLSPVSFSWTYSLDSYTNYINHTSHHIAYDNRELMKWNITRYAHVTVKYSTSSCCNLPEDISMTFLCPLYRRQQEIEAAGLENPALMSELRALRQRKDELETHLATLQDSRRQLMVQLEGLMKMLKVLRIHNTC